MSGYLNLAALTLAVLSVTALAGRFALAAFAQWIDLKKLELANYAGGPVHDSTLAPTAGRIELADLKERVRKLEAIASGIDY